MKILNKRLYTIDASEKLFKQRENVESPKFDNYILGELKRIQNNISRFKRYKEDPLTVSTVVSNANLMIDCLSRTEISSDEQDLNELDKYFEIIAQKLRQAEEKSQDEMNITDNKIIKGTVLLALIYEENQLSFLVIKFEHKGYWSGVNFLHESGIPDSTEDLQLKVSYLDYKLNDSSSYELNEIYISERKNSKYWPEYFMQVTPLTDSEKATGNAITELNKIFRSIKSTYPNDYAVLHSNYISYLSSKERFLYNEFCEQVFDSYLNSNPNSEFKKDKYISKLDEKIIKNDLQGEFEIIQRIVKRKLIAKKVRINNFFELKRIKSKAEIANTDFKLSKNVICLLKGNGDEYYLNISINNSELDKFKEYDYNNVL